MADEDFEIKDNVLVMYHGKGGDVVIPDSITSIGKEAFKWCIGLTSVTIPVSVTEIGRKAFDGCINLTSVTIPDNVTSIGAWAFYKCSSLTGVTIGNSVTEIGENAFDGCINLTSVTIPDNVTSIGTWAFYNCSSLTSVTIPVSVTEIGRKAFDGCINLTSVTIPDSVTSIGEEVFKGCSSLTSVTIGNSVTEIGENAFYSCSSLTSVTIPDSVTSIGAWAFYNCSSLTSITIGNSVTSIGENAFYSCGSLTSVTIGNSVTEIGKSAFAECSNIKKLIFKNKDIKLRKSYFNSDFNVIKATADNIYPKQLSSELKEVLLPDVSKLLSEDKDLDIEWKKTWLKYLKSKRKSLYSNMLKNNNLLNVILREKYLNLEETKELTALAAEKSFVEASACLLDYQNKNFTEDEVVESTIKELSVDTTSLSYLKKIWTFKKLEDGTISITNYKGTDLNVVVPDVIGKDKVTAIGEGAFSPDGKRITDEQRELRKKITSITIPEGITSIGEKAFDNCKNLIINVITFSYAYFYAIDYKIPFNDVNDGTVKECKADESVLTSKPVILEKGTDGTAGTDGTYVLFGDWPQSLKADDVTIDTTTIYKMNGWDCFKGNDGCFYVIKAAKFFKMESIKWRILEDNYSGGKLLLAEQILTTGCYYPVCWNNRTIEDKTVYPNNYQYSQIRAYLNGLDGTSYNVKDYSGNGFINRAFSASAQTSINTVYIDNGKKSTTDSGNNIPKAKNYSCINTKDKIFLLSEKEITSKEYRFDEYNKEDSVRQRKNTDYSKAMGAGSDNENNSWWLRSPSFNCDYTARYVDCSGNTYVLCWVNSGCNGVVPALTMNF